MVGTAEQERADSGATVLRVELETAPGWEDRGTWKRQLSVVLPDFNARILEANSSLPIFR